MKTVLLAYDRDQDLAALETLLQSRNHRVLKSRSGVEALEVARREAPHVIVSDVLLPKLDGFALCRRVKEDPLLAHVPVLKRLTRMPVCIDPSHSVVSREAAPDRILDLVHATAQGVVAYQVNGKTASLGGQPGYIVEIKAVAVRRGA